MPILAQPTQRRGAGVAVRSPNFVDIIFRCVNITFDVHVRWPQVGLVGAVGLLRRGGHQSHPRSPRGPSGVIIVPVICLQTPDLHG